MTNYQIHITNELIANAGVRREEMGAWIVVHGQDPNDVPVPCVIEIEDDMVTIPLYVRVNGRRVFDDSGDAARRTSITVPLVAPWPLTEVTS